jgi:WD40 repeat protein
MKKILFIAFTFILFFSFIGFNNSDKTDQGCFLGISDLLVIEQENKLFISSFEQKKIEVYNQKNKKLIKSLHLDENPNKLFYSENGKLLVLSGIKNGKLHIFDTKSLKKENEIIVGHSPVDIIENKDHFIICNRFPGEIRFLEKKKFECEKKLTLGREPIAMSYSPKTGILYVAHHLPEMASTSQHVASKISVVNCTGHKIVENILLPNGANSVKDIALSGDEKYLFIPHILARFNLPTTQLERGWMNTNVLSVMNTENLVIEHTILLDDIDHGAANPWAVNCSENGKFLYITHAGTHELSIIDWDRLRDSLIQIKNVKTNYGTSESLGFIYSFRKRMKLHGNGPRSLAITENEIIVGNYFSNNLSIIGIEDFKQESVLLSNLLLTAEKSGEMHFNDGAFCFQNWQSCVSCHPDSRVDGLNWDLLNDGIGNPKNTKSMIYSHSTPPVMALGVRAHAGIAVRAGFKYIQFSDVPEKYSSEVDSYLKSLVPEESPFATDEKLIDIGKDVFYSKNCQDCHSGEYFTDLKSYTLAGPEDLNWDTPALNELWRTGPYWHDGRYASIREMYEKDYHGLDEPLSTPDILALEAYLMSL